MDPFDTLGVEPDFSLDLAELAARQRDLSRALHPDRYVGRSSHEKRAALGRAIEVNEAYRCLKAPISRAEALLQVLEMTLPESEHPPAPPELLMEMMEVREELRAVAKKQDADGIEALVATLKKEEAKVLESLREGFTVALARRTKGESSDARSIYESLSALRYFRRFFDEANGLLDELL